MRADRDAGRPRRPGSEGFFCITDRNCGRISSGKAIKLCAADIGAKVRANQLIAFAKDRIGWMIALKSVDCIAGLRRSIVG